jgi:hypothetical protein
VQLKLIFPHSCITIELIQHPTIEKWFKFFQPLVSQQPGYYRMCMSEEFSIHPRSYIDADHHWQVILDSIQELKDVNYRMPFEITDQYDYNQATLNKLHRFFTYNCEWWSNQLTEANPFDDTFTPPADWNFEKWHSVIAPINEAVHNLEDVTSTNTKLFWRDPTGRLTFTTWTINNPGSITGLLNKTCYLLFDSDDLSFNYKSMDFSQGAPVTLNASILGKCTLQSYFEEDDPTARDARGREGSYGGFTIHLNRRREEIYQSEYFRQWAASYGRTVESLPLEFQIGHVIGTSIEDLYKFDPQQYIRTEFVD